MRDLESIRELLRKHKEHLAREFGVKSIAIFGSYAKGTAKETSDLDMLCPRNSLDYP